MWWCGLKLQLSKVATTTASVASCAHYCVLAGEHYHHDAMILLVIVINVCYTYIHMHTYIHTVTCNNTQRKLWHTPNGPVQSMVQVLHTPAVLT